MAALVRRFRGLRGGRRGSQLRTSFSECREIPLRLDVGRFRLRPFPEHRFRLRDLPQGKQREGQPSQAEDVPAPRRKGGLQVRSGGEPVVLAREARTPYHRPQDFDLGRLDGPRFEMGEGLVRVAPFDVQLQQPPSQLQRSGILLDGLVEHLLRLILAAAQLQRQAVTDGGKRGDLLKVPGFGIYLSEPIRGFIRPCCEVRPPLHLEVAAQGAEELRVCGENIESLQANGDLDGRRVGYPIE